MTLRARVLIMGYDPASKSLVLTSLEREGWTVTKVQDSGEGVSLVQIEKEVR